MKAAILAVGTELLGIDRLDTNSLALTNVLRRHGVELVRKAVVGDEEEEISAELERLGSDVDLVLVTGGLGPTADDVTREAMARLVGRSLTLDEATFDRMAKRFSRLGRPMPAVNRRQAEVVEGAEVWENRRGIAPAQRIEHRSTHYVLFPGVPGELEALVEDGLEPWLLRQGDGGAIEERELRVACLPESAVEELIAPAYGEFGRSDLSVLAGLGEVKLRLRSRGSAEERRSRLDAMSARLEELVGDALFSFGGGETLEQVVGRLLESSGRTVATAESCTGGLLAERLTRTPGSSAYFSGAVVAYCNELKVRLLGIEERLLEEHGAVSRPVAEGMASNVRQRLGTSYGIGITGVAGPGGGSEAKPVGTVHLALAGPAETDLEHVELHYPYDRERVRWLSSQVALDLLRRNLLAVADAGGGKGRVSVGGDA